MTICPFKNITGYPCPGCGGIRATIQLLQGNIVEALYINPLAVIAELLVVIALLWWIVDKIRGTETLKSIMYKPLPIAVYAALLIAVLLNWYWNIQKGL